MFSAKKISQPRADVHKNLSHTHTLSLESQRTEALEADAVAVWGNLIIQTNSNQKVRNGHNFGQVQARKLQLESFCAY
jgi:hypothetical protein